MADWDEIKRLAADFERTQTSDTLQRLSERNWIDIVKKLIELKLIDLIFTCNGKGFVTPEHIRKEIQDEVYVNGGRMHLHDLANKLNIDYQHVENKAQELAKDQPEEYSLILGQVIHSTYKSTLGKHIHDCMITRGQLSIAEFAKSLDLPSEFLLNIVKELLPKVMDGEFVVGQDERTFYTSDMMDRYKSITAGTLSAILKPTTIASLLKRLEIPERIFMPIVDGLIKEGRIDASVENRLFIPSVYARKQNEWIDKFYSSNSYIDYDVLSRMDIKQPKTFLKKRFPDGIQLKTCFISQDLLSQVESLIEDSIASNSWIDISTIVPSAMQPEDIEQILQDIFKKNKQFKISSSIFDQTYVCSLGYIETCKSSFNSLMQTRANEHLQQGKLADYFNVVKIPKEEKPSKETQVVEKDTGSSNQEKEGKENVANKVASQVNEDESQQSAKGSRKERKDKKAKAEVIEPLEDSDEDQGSKKSKSRKSGSGREIKQRSVKKKYIPGQPKATPSSKPAPALKPKEAQSITSPTQKEPLVFMKTMEIVDQLKAKGSSEPSDSFFASIAGAIEDELNFTYKTLAKQTLDEFLRSQDDEEQEESCTDVMSLV